jgi:Mg2+ and Co2+ transporter CorA
MGNVEMTEMMDLKDKVIHMNDLLFETLDRLMEMSLDNEAIEKEHARARLLADVSDKVIKGGMLAVALEKLVGNSPAVPKQAMRLLG